ncbi:MAG TPA: hypothetical protein VFA96_09675 [Nocardioides sp.]|nr:hypothetical protein [Nocardioides sp.]
MKKVAAIVVSCVAVLSLVACGSSSKKASTSKDTTTTVGATASASASVAADLLKYCDASKAAEAVNASTLVGNTDLKTSLTNLNANLDTWVKVAPSEIKSDVQLEVDKALKPLIAEMARVNYDFTKANISVLQSLNTPEIQAASKRISDYYAAHCNK